MKKRSIALALALVMLAALLSGCGSPKPVRQENAYVTGDYGSSYYAPTSMMAESAAEADGYWAEVYEAEDTAPVPAPSSRAQSAAQTTAQTTAKLIYTANLDMETLDFTAAIQSIDALTEACGGYYESSSVSDQGSYRRASYTVRVPAEKYREFLDSAGELCHVLSRQEYTEDVSEAYYDTDGRLATQRTKLGRLQALLEAAEDMEDIITLEDAISETEETIERLSGTLRHYDALVDYSTVDITVREVKVYEPEPPETFGSRLAAAFKTGWQGFVGGMADIAVALAYSWLWLVVIAVVVVVIVKLAKKRRASRPAREKKSRRKGKKTAEQADTPAYTQPANTEDDGE